MAGSDPLMAAAAHDGRLWVAEGALQRWTPVDVPWQRQQIVAIALPPPGDCAGWLFVATLTPESNQVIIWQRTPAGAWEAVITQEDVGDAAIAVPPGTPWSGRWFAALGDQLFELKATPSAERDGVRPSAEHGPADARPAIRDLTAVQGSHQGDLLAITTRGLYFRPGNSREWQPVDHGTVPRPIVAARPSSGFERDGCCYALEMGGVLWRVLPGRASLPGHGA
jgi:hypothetical protein